MLTEMQVRNAKGRDKVYRLVDSDGLYLFVTSRGHRSWRMKYRFAGKGRRLIFGAQHELSLREARNRRSAAPILLRDGRDPGIEAVKARVGRAIASANPSKALVRAWYGLQERRWTPIHARDVIVSLEREILTGVGELQNTEIDEPMVLPVLRKIEKRGAIETAHRVRQRMSAARGERIICSGKTMASIPPTHCRAAKAAPLRSHRPQP